MALGKSLVLLIWDTRKNKLYGDRDGETSGCSCFCPLNDGILQALPAYCGCLVNGVIKRYTSDYFVSTVI